MKQKNNNFLFRLFGVVLLSVFTLTGIGVSSASAAGITATIDQSPSGPVQVDPTNVSPIVFRVVFSQSVADFAAGDVDLSGSTGGGAGLSYIITGTGAVYNVSVSGMASGDTVVATIPADVVSAGAATNSASTSGDNSVFYETVKPTVTINQAGGQADPTNVASISYTAIFSEPVNSFAFDDINVTGTAPGTKSVVVTPIDPMTYTVTVTGMTGTGTVIATVKPNAARDAAGNWNVGSTSTDKTVTYDITPPTVTIDQSPSGPVQADPANTSPIIFNVVFSEAVTGFIASDVSFTGSTTPGSLSATIVGSGALYAVRVTGMASGDTVVVSLPLNAATDLAGNNSAASTSTDNSVTYDTTPPTVTINQAGSQADPTASQPIVFTAVFSENVTGVDATDIAVGGTAPGTKSVTIIPIDAKNYTVQITGVTGAGNVSVSVKTNAARDAALNWSLSSTSTDNSVEYRSALVVDIASDVNHGACVLGNCSLRDAVIASGAGDIITFNLPNPSTITLTSAIDINRNITIAGPGAEKLTVQGAGSNRVFSGHVGNTIAISDLTILNGSDAAQGGGIKNFGTLTLNNLVLSNNAAPSGGAIYNQGTLTITKSTLSLNTGTSGAGIYNTGTLSMTNVTIGNNTASGQGGGIYNAGGATVNLLHTSVVDNPGGGVYNLGTLNYTSTVIAKNGTAGDCILSGGTIGTNVTNFVGTATCSASLSGNPLMDALGSSATEPLDTFALLSGSPLLNVANAGTCPATDERGVARPVGPGCDIGAFEGNRPSVTVNQAPGQADPTASSTILFKVVFGDPVTGFANNDVLLSGTAPGTLSPSVSQIAPNDGTTYQISVTGVTGTGTVIAVVKSGAVTNGQGIANGASSSTDNTVTYDITAPTVTINQSPTGPAQADPTNSSPIVFSVVFSEPVTGFTSGDVSFTGSTNPGGLSATIVGSADLYAVKVTGMASGDTVVVSIPASAVTDLAGNNSAASTSTDNSVTYDTTAPTVTINQAGTQVDPAVSEPVVFTAIFSESVTGFDATDVQLSGTAGGTRTITIVPVNSFTYRVEITNVTSGTLTATVKPNAAQDAALNWSSGSTSTDNTVTVP